MSGRSGSNQYRRRPHVLRPPVGGQLLSQANLAPADHPMPTGSEWWATLKPDRVGAAYWEIALHQVGLELDQIARVPVAAIYYDGDDVQLVGLFELTDGQWALLDIDAHMVATDVLDWNDARADRYTAPTLLQLVQHVDTQTEASVEAYETIAGSLSIPPEVLQSLVEYHPDQLYVGELDELSQLAQQRRRSWTVHVLRALAGNPACPIPVLLRMLEGPDRRVAEIAADNPALPAAARAMWQLAHQ